MTPVEEIKLKLPIEEVIGEYVSLKRAGSNFKGLCPFHQEKTPSFMVSADKQIWHCFGCTEGGDVFGFIQKYEGMGFKEAVTMLAKKAGVVLHDFVVQDSGKKNILFELHEVAREFYAKQLHADSPDAAKTRDYLAARGMTTETMEQWSLGLSVDTWDGLLKHLQMKKFSMSDVVSSGLVVTREQRHYDRFRRRLMFPIRDAQGRTVAFTARTLQRIAYDDDDIGGKYVNSPQTTIYNKSQILYGFDQARHEIKRKGYVILVEGNMDVIMSHQAGIKNVIGVSGTALTLDQLTLLKRYTENLILSFDSDAAGSQAVFRGITLAWDFDMNIKVIVLQEGKDPADVVLKDPELWKQAIRDSQPVVDYYIDAVCNRVDLNRSDHKKLAVRKIASILARLKTDVERAHYVQTVSGRLHVPEYAIIPEIKRAQGQSVRQEAPVAPLVTTKTAPGVSLSRCMLGLVAQYPAFIERLIQEVEVEVLDTEVQELYKKIIVQYTNGDSSDLKKLSLSLTQPDVRLWSELVFEGEQLYADLPAPEQETEFQGLLKRLKTDYYTKKSQALTNAIKQAEHEGRDDLVEQLVQEHQALVRRRANSIL